MKNKIFQKRTLSFLLTIVGISIVIIIVLLGVLKTSSAIKTETMALKSASSDIQADGQIVPQNQATMHFQTGGKLVYLPVKVGDTVKQGQIIASLDTAKLEANLRQALQDFNAAQAVVQQVYDQTGRVSNLTFAQNVTQTAAEATQNKAYDAVVKARQDIADAALVSPIDGIITHEDVTTINTNVTSATEFTVSDLSSLVFRANVLENDIDFVSVGSTVAINLGSGNKKQILGTVNKIYPDKITLPSSQKAYQVDITSTEIGKSGVMGQSGTALIQSNMQNTAKLVPTWTVLNHDSVWVLANGKVILRHITVGKIHGDTTEVLNGLEPNDFVITNPEAIVAEKYQIL